MGSSHYYTLSSSTRIIYPTTRCWSIFPTKRKSIKSKFLTISR
nr:MAG TPA: hypothetical protein [Bacteriophage sp.]